MKNLVIRQGHSNQVTSETLNGSGLVQFRERLNVLNDLLSCSEGSIASMPENELLRHACWLSLGRHCFADSLMRQGRDVNREAFAVECVRVFLLSRSRTEK